jgi:hypothetical protein
MFCSTDPLEIGLFGPISGRPTDGKAEKMPEIGGFRAICLVCDFMRLFAF